jgi:hypothetical protein
MKKKVIIVYQVSYETEIEVDTNLPSGQYDQYMSQENVELYLDQINDITDSVEVDNIAIPENETSFYRKQSFEITSFEIV